MVNNPAWAYLDKMVARRNSLTLSRRIRGGYAACINGHYFGLAETCKAAVVKAVRDTKRHKTNGR